MMKDDVVERLCRTYREAEQIGLVLGAGVSKDSGVPLFRELAPELVKDAVNGRMLKGAPRAAIAYLTAKQRSADQDPQKVIQFISQYIDSRQSLQRLLKQALYRNVDAKRSHKMVPSRAYKLNETLDAIITFCAAIPGSMLAAGSGSKRFDTNRRIGGILTTNYDNLVEGSFGSKYGVRLLKPVAREGSRESVRGKRVIPVYHMHGYVSYVDDPNKRDRVKASERLVITEDDYYWTFYNLLGFSNVVAMSFLRRFPCLFVGCRMDDRNIRRILYHLQRERISATDVNEHFAILPPLDQKGEQEYEDAVLRAFGVTAIRLSRPDNLGPQVAAILKRLYLSLEGVTEDLWRKAKKGWAKSS